MDNRLFTENRLTKWDENGERYYLIDMDLNRDDVVNLLHKYEQLDICEPEIFAGLDDTSDFLDLVTALGRAEDRCESAAKEREVNVSSAFPDVLNEVESHFKNSNIKGYEVLSVAPDPMIEGGYLVKTRHLHASPLSQGEFAVFRYDRRKEVQLNFGRYDLTEEIANAFMENGISDLAFSDEPEDGIRNVRRHHR